MLKESVALYIRLFQFVKPHWRMLVLAGICMLPLALCSSALAYLVKPALDDIFFKKNLTMLRLVPLGIILLYAVRGVFDYSHSYFMGYVGNRIIADIREQVYVHLQRLSLSYFAKNPTGVLMTRITNDVNILQTSISKVIISFFKDLFTIAGLVGVLFYQDWKLACIAFLIMPWVIIPIQRFGKKSRRFSTRGQEKVGKIATLLHETITGCRIVKAFGMEDYEAQRFSEENYRFFKIRLRRLRIRAISSPLMEFIGGIAGAAVVFYGGYSVINGTSTPGTFFSFVTALLLLYEPVRDISTSYQDIQEGLAAAVRVFQVLDSVPEIQDKPGARSLPAVSGAVSFRSVSFGYDKRLVLHDIGLEVQPGEIIAIVGTTGAGKTSLVNLIPRFYDVTAGAILIDGCDVRDITLYSLRSQIALVSQQTILFNDTVRENIAYGTPDPPWDKILEAARAARADEFIARLAEGYDTIIGEAGVKLSGGQRQRLAIARALFKNAPILILDEATSSLDSKSEEEVQQALENLMKNRTTFIVAHRLSTIRKAHRIVVLAHGRIVEQGTHDELFSRGGEYQKLYAFYFQEQMKKPLGNNA
jgi:subfamily B ATP-binding cassette protein MsbA